MGNYFKPLGPDSGIVNELMLESLSKLPVRVLNLGPQDLFFWKTLSLANLPFTQIISTNLTPRSPSIPIPARYALVEIPAQKLDLKKSVCIGFLGLSRPDQVKPNSGFSALDPMQAVSRVKAEVLKQADFLIILADLSKTTAVRLAAAHPEISAILVAEKHFVFPAPEQVNKAIILSSVERGRYLGQLELQLDRSGQVFASKSDRIELKQGIPEFALWQSRQAQVVSRLP